MKKKTKDMVEEVAIGIVVIGLLCGAMTWFAMRTDKMQANMTIEKYDSLNPNK